MSNTLKIQHFVEKNELTAGRCRWWYKYCITRQEPFFTSKLWLAGAATSTGRCCKWFLSCCWCLKVIGACWVCGKDCIMCCWSWVNLCCCNIACSCGFWWPCSSGSGSSPCSSCWITIRCMISSFKSSLAFFEICTESSGACAIISDMALDAARLCACSRPRLCCMMEPSITEESDVLFDENDIGEAGRRMHGSLLMLALRCNCVPERAELASLTIEFAPTLGPEEFPALLRIQLVMSTDTGLSMRCLFSVDKFRIGAWFCSPPWKKRVVPWEVGPIGIQEPGRNPVASVSLSYKSPQGRVITPNPPAMRTMTSNADEPQKRPNTQKSQKLLQETKERALPTSKRFREGKEKHHNTKKIQHKELEKSFKKKPFEP